MAADNSGQTYFLYSQDLGQNWSNVPVDNDYNFGFELQAFCFPYSCKVSRVVVNTHLNAQDSFAILEASPPYDRASWKQYIDAEIGGWVSGTNCAQYISSAGSTLRWFLRWRK